MTYQVIVSKAVQKQIEKLPLLMQIIIKEKLSTLKSDPRPSGIVKLKGYDFQYRLRVSWHFPWYQIFLIRIVGLAPKTWAYYSLFLGLLWLLLPCGTITIPFGKLSGVITDPIASWCSGRRSVSLFWAFSVSYWWCATNGCPTSVKPSRKHHSSPTGETAIPSLGR